MQLSLADQKTDEGDQGLIRNGYAENARH
jgi:hypothetical protein